MPEILAVTAPESPPPVQANDESLALVQAVPDCPPDELAERRYVEALDQLLDDALERRHVEQLAEALTWQLARIGYGFGMVAIGDILRRLGGHVNQIAAREAAQREAEEAKKAGRMTQ